MEKMAGWCFNAEAQGRRAVGAVPTPVATANAARYARGICAARMAGETI